MAFTTDIYGSCSDGMFYCLALWANTVTNGAFWTLLLIGFGIVLIMGASVLPGIGFTRAFGFAGTMCMFAAIFLFTLNLMTWWILSIFVIVGCISIISLVVSERI
jgi:hypothetical protein